MHLLVLNRVLERASAFALVKVRLDVFGRDAVQLVKVGPGEDEEIGLTSGVPRGPLNLKFFGGAGSLAHLHVWPEGTAHALSLL